MRAASSATSNTDASASASRVCSRRSLSGMERRVPLRCYGRAVATPRDPEEMTAVATATVASLPAATTMGPVHLTVADLRRSLAYYRSAIGLQVLGQEGGRAVLGAAGRELLVLVEEPGARPALGHTGLY